MQVKGAYQAGVPGGQVVAPYSSGPSVVPVAAIVQETPALRRRLALLRTPTLLVIIMRAKPFHRHYSEQPALLSRL